MAESEPTKPRGILANNGMDVEFLQSSLSGADHKGLLDFFDELKELKCGFVSLRDAVDLSTPSGRLMLTVLAAVAQFETEVRSERQRAGIAAVRDANGGKCTWGGRKAGTRIKVTEEKERAILSMKAANKPISEIARVTELTRPTVYRVLARHLGKEFCGSILEPQNPLAVQPSR